MSLLTKVIQPVNVWTTKTFLGRRPWNEGLMRYNQRKLKELQRACIAIREVSSLPPTPNKAVTLERFENQEGKDNGSQNEWVSQVWNFLNVSPPCSALGLPAQVNHPGRTWRWGAKGEEQSWERNTHFSSFPWLFRQRSGKTGKRPSWAPVDFSFAFLHLSMGQIGIIGYTSTLE